MIVEWTEPAKRDVRSIHDHIAENSKLYARRTVIRFERAVRQLKRFPDIGGAVQEWNNPKLRELIVGSYRVIYRREERVVQILTVLHGARRLPDADSLEEGGKNGT